MPKDTICPSGVEFDPTTYEHNDLLLDPYQSAIDTTSRFSSDIPEATLPKFKAIIPYRGAIQATINTLLYGLLAEFERRGIRNYDPEHKPQIVKIIKSRAFGEKK